MKKFLLSGNYSAALLFLRLSAGGFMLFGHGAGKVLNFGTMFHNFGNPIGIGPEASYILNVFAEFVCSLLLISGLFTRLAAIPLVINMAVITLAVHLHDPWMKKEFALLYFIAFFTILLAGPGKYSLDTLLFGSKHSPELMQRREERMKSSVA